MMIYRILTIAIGLAVPGLLMAQQCNSSINATTPIHRFTLNGDGTVTDSRSGLQWQRCPVGYTLDDNGTALVIADDKCELTGTTTFNWQAALQAADSLNTNGGFAGFGDWRVPNVKELISIVEFKCIDPAVNLTLFPDTEPELFWSSSTTNQIGSALVLDLKSGNNSFSYMDIAGFEHYVRLVRGGN